MTKQQKKGLTVAAVSIGSLVFTSVAAFAIFCAYMRRNLREIELADCLCEDDTNCNTLDITWAH